MAVELHGHSACLSSLGARFDRSLATPPPPPPPNINAAEESTHRLDVGHLVHGADLQQVLVGELVLPHQRVHGRGYHYGLGVHLPRPHNARQQVVTQPLHGIWYVNPGALSKKYT